MTMSAVTRLNPFVGWLALFRLPAFIVVILALSSIPAASRETPAPNNALLNGDLVRGNGDAPESWDTRAYKNGDQFTIYRWNHAAGTPASLEISSIKPNDAHWEQQVRLAPGWYYFSAEVRAQDVGTGGTGACRSLIDQGVFVSLEVSGTTD